MPRYVTASALRARLGELDLVVLADRANKPGARVTIASAIADAEEFVDSIIGVRYPLPLPGIVSLVDPALNTVPGLLVLLTVDITIRNLARFDEGLMSDTIKELYDEAVKQLERIRDRKATLGLLEGQASTAGALTVGPCREYSHRQTDGLV